MKKWKCIQKTVSLEHDGIWEWWGEWKEKFEMWAPARLWKA